MTINGIELLNEGASTPGGYYPSDGGYWQDTTSWTNPADDARDKIIMFGIAAVAVAFLVYQWGR